MCPSPFELVNERQLFSFVLLKKLYIYIKCDKIRCFYFSILCIINSETLPVNCEKTDITNIFMYIHIV